MATPFWPAMAPPAVPGPLFTFAAYLGTVMQAAPGGWQGALVCLVAVFAPSFLLVVGVLPYWTELRRLTGVRRALLGVNAAVVGLLLAAFYDPVWTSAMHTPADFLLALGAYLGLARARLSSRLVVVLGALCGWGLELAGCLKARRAPVRRRVGTSVLVLAEETLELLLVDVDFLD